MNGIARCLLRHRSYSAIYWRRPVCTSQTKHGKRNVPKMADYANPRKDLRKLYGSISTIDMVDFLNDMSARDVCVIQLPQEMSYADHMILCTCASGRHLRAAGSEAKKFLKSKIGPEKARFAPLMEGSARAGDGWLALDCGNFVVHLFDDVTRKKYDIETLWTVGPEFDELSRGENDIDFDFLSGKM